MQQIIAQIAQEIKVQAKQVQAAVELMDGGATVPFIARYRKEVTDGLDDIQLRELEARLGYLRELRDRREVVIKAIDEQGKLTPALLAALAGAGTKQELEDLYLPFKLKRRTKGQLAREAGLEPLADALFAFIRLDRERRLCDLRHRPGRRVALHRLCDGHVHRRPSRHRRLDHQGRPHRRRQHAQGVLEHHLAGPAPIRHEICPKPGIVALVLLRSIVQNILAGRLGLEAGCTGFVRLSDSANQAGGGFFYPCCPTTNSPYTAPRLHTLVFKAP